MLAVSMVLTDIGFFQHNSGIGIAFSCTIHFQFYPKITRAGAIENWRRLIVVSMNRLILPVALMAVWGIIIVAFIIGILLGKYDAAAFAGYIVSVVTSAAERCPCVSCIILPKNPLATMLTEYCEFLHTVSTIFV